MAKERRYSVPYRVTYQGVSIVAADNPADAHTKVFMGEFDEDDAQQRLEWRPVGQARLFGGEQEKKEQAED